MSSAFWTYLITGILCGWPPAAAGMWLTWYLAKKQVAKAVAKANDAQLDQLAQANRTQVAALLARSVKNDPPGV